MPLHPEYKALMKGTVADLTNAAAKRKAGTIVGRRLPRGIRRRYPWAHLDIAGTAWDVGRAYTGNDASGYGVRLLTGLARSYAGRSRHGSFSRRGSCSVAMPWASSLPLSAAVSFASAVAWRRPR